MSDNVTKTIELPTELVRRMDIAVKISGRSFNEIVAGYLDRHLQTGIEQEIFSAIGGLKGRVLDWIGYATLLNRLEELVSIKLGKKIGNEDLMFYFKKMYKISELKDGRLLIE